MFCKFVFNIQAMRFNLLSIVLVFYAGISNTFSQGCSQCKMLAEQAGTADEASFGSNINYGILYLMIIPYLILMFLFRNQIKRFLLSLFKIASK
jgi:hypothetical protein